MSACSRKVFKLDSGDVFGLGSGPRRTPIGCKIDTG